MISSIRKLYNESFTPEKYQSFVNDLSSVHPGQLDFRVAETPVFVDTDFRNKMLEACETIIDIIIDPSFKDLTEKAIPQDLNVPAESQHPDFIAFDFGICKNDKGELEPQLIEMQGFASLFCYQVLFPEVHHKHFNWPGNFSNYLNGYSKENYIGLLKKVILGNHAPENVILLEIFPEQQKTRIDFACTREYLGIGSVCLTKLIKEGRKLFYEKEGQRIEIKRIYNRLIFDDLLHQPEDVKKKADILTQPLDVEWAGHPNWFYRISKFTLPFIRHAYVPPTYFLHELKERPSNLSDYVLKPLFSFAGQGVVIDVTQDDLDKITDPQNWILQRKVQYADIIETPDIPAKAEIRIFYFWENGKPRPVAANNLARLSKGKMVGVRYNKDKEWVGGSFCLFEE